MQHGLSQTESKIGFQRTELIVREEKDGKFTVPDLKKVTVNTHAEAYEWLRRGLTNRHVSQTTMNASSSRSHTIFQIEL